jgi:phosphoribosylglycinamide formyltransferase-1
MKALAEACKRGQVPAEVGAVIASRSQAPAVETAHSLGLDVAVVPYDNESDYSDRLLQALRDCDFICLAGYMRLLPKEILDKFPHKILNVHPALLPKFGGKGMYGRHVHEAVLAANEKESGVTVHFVNERYDEGEIILQMKCPVLPDDTPETLADRVLKLEHVAYPKALKMAIERDPLS